MIRLVVHSTCALTVLALAAFPGITGAEEAQTYGAGYWVPSQPPRACYRIDCTIKAAEEMLLQGKETIDFVNTTSMPMRTLAVTWFKQKNQTLSITANGKAVALPSTLESFPLHFTLPEPLGSGESLTLE
ncbi:MAG: hypothetical protein JSW47_04400, partial [Phycisphaerales bacterium]